MNWQLHLDIKTALVIVTFVALVPSLMGVLIWFTRRTCPGFGRWTVANLLGALCFALLGLRGTAPDWISIVLANASALGAAILLLQGLRLRWWPECLAGLSAIAAVIYFRYVTNNLNVRTVAMSAVLGTICLCSGVTLLKSGPSGRRFSTVFTGIVFILFGAGNFLRMYFYTSAPANDFFAPSGPSGSNAAFFAVAGLGIVGWSFGFLLMTDERLALGSTGERDGFDPIEVKAVPQAAILPQAIPEAEVRQQLQRIVESDPFRRSARMERFLMVAADRALLGQREGLKEYILGRDVFDRGENYDPRTDAIVRVEAQRLRRKLREYYESYGESDPIIVEFYPGSYVPRFKYRKHTSNDGF